MNIFGSISDYFNPETRTLSQWLIDVSNANPYFLNQDGAFQVKYGAQVFLNIHAELEKTEAGRERLQEVFTVAQKNEFLEALDGMPTITSEKTINAKQANTIVNNLLEIGSEPNAPEIKAAGSVITENDVAQSDLVIQETVEVKAEETVKVNHCSVAPQGWKLVSDDCTYRPETPFDGDAEHAAYLQEKEPKLGDEVKKLYEDTLKKNSLCLPGDRIAEEARLAEVTKTEFEKLGTCVDGDAEHTAYLEDVERARLAAEKLANTYTVCSTLPGQEEVCEMVEKNTDKFENFQAILATKVPGTHCYQSHAEGAEKICTTIEQTVEAVDRVKACVGDTCEALEKGSDALAKFTALWEAGTCTSQDQADCVSMCLDEACKLVDKDVAEQGLGALAWAGIAGGGLLLVGLGKAAWNKLFGKTQTLTDVVPVFPDANEPVELENQNLIQPRVEDVDQAAREQAERQAAEAERARQEAAEAERARQEAEAERARQEAEELFRQQQALLVQQQLEAQRRREAEEEQRRREAEEEQRRRQPQQAAPVQWIRGKV